MRRIPRRGRFRGGAAYRVAARMDRTFARNALVLGLLTAVGPFAIDMYLPAFPAIAADLRTDAGLVQLSLTSYFAAVALFQIVYGPASDRLGRKPPLYVGLLLYVAGAVGCALSTGVWGLIGFRFLQGVGGCAAIVITRAIVRDLHTGARAAKLMATIMLVFSVSPMVAPLVGSALAHGSAWRWIFWIIAGIGLSGVAVALTLLPETRPPESRNPGPLRRVVGDYLLLLKNPHYLGMVAIGGFGQATFFAYLGGSSDVFQDHFGLTPGRYAAMFAFNAAAFIGAAQLNSSLMTRFGATRVVAAGLVGLAAFVAALLAVTLAGVDRVGVVVALLFPSFACLGSLIPSSAVLAIDPHGAIAGTAAALMGTLQLAVGAAAVGVVGATFDGTAVPMVCAMAACAALAGVAGLLTLRPGDDAAFEPNAARPIPSSAEVQAELPGGLSEV